MSELRLEPPYSEEILKELARNVDDGPFDEGYPVREQRLFMARTAIQAALVDGVLHLPAGHDALGSPNRRRAPEHIRATMDPEIATGSDEELSLGRQIALMRQGVKVFDQHGRPIHPGYEQILQLQAEDGRELGAPTGIGQFYRYGPNHVSDGIVFRPSRQKGGPDEVLLIYRPRAGWATPGGYAEADDYAKENPAIACARREVHEETGLLVAGLGCTAARMLPFSSPHTLNAWTETTAVAFLDEDPERLHDLDLKPSQEVDDAQWQSAQGAINDELTAGKMWSNDHRRYIEAAYKLYRQQTAKD